LQGEKAIKKRSSQGVARALPWAGTPHAVGLALELGAAPPSSKKTLTTRAPESAQLFDLCVTPSGIKKCL